MTHLPSNYSAPTEEQLRAQLKREERQAEDGRYRAERQLAKQKETADYSRSQAGQLIVRGCVHNGVIALEEHIESLWLPGARTAKAEKIAAYKALKFAPKVLLPTIDSKTHEVISSPPEGPAEAIDLWSPKDMIWVTLLTMLDNAWAPIHKQLNLDEQDTGRRKARVRLDNYGLKDLILERIQSQARYDYIRACTKGTGEESLMDNILKSLRHEASYSQKVANTRLMLNRKASEFDQYGLHDFAHVLRWKALTKKEGLVLVSLLMASANRGLQAHLGCNVFDPETIYTQARSNKPTSRTYLSLTDQGKALLHEIDTKEIERAFVPDVMVCPPRPHSHTETGGYWGVAAPMIKRSFGASPDGKFVPSDQHLRLLNRQQNVPYRISQPVLQLLNGLTTLGAYEHRCLDKFRPLPNLDDFVTITDIGAPDGLSPEELEARSKRKEARSEQFKEFHNARDKAEKSKADRTLEMANNVADLERFWLPMFGGWRGRIYCANSLLNSQGASHQRNLLEFADPVPVDTRTKYHLQISIAGYAGQDKKSYADRLSWFIQHEEVIMDSLRDWDHILDPKSWWRTYEEMDDPIAFFACAYEYKRLFIDSHPYRKTHVIIHRDATASGAQIISALLRDGKTAKSVNLLNTATDVNDLYVEILDKMKEFIREDDRQVALRTPNGKATKEFMTRRRTDILFSRNPEAIAKLRKGIKAALLPRLYGSEEKCSIDALLRKTRLHGQPRLDGWERDWSLDKTRLTLHEAYGLAPYFERALAAVMPSLVIYVAWAKALADKTLKTTRTLSKTGKLLKNPAREARLKSDGCPVDTVKFETPNGSLLIERYKKTATETVVHDHICSQSLFAPRKPRDRPDYKEPTSKVDHTSMVGSTPPNAIHAMDACLLAMTVDGFDGNFSLIHDSFGCSPGKPMDDLMERANDAFIRLVEFDYLGRALELNNVDAVDHPVPNLSGYKPEDSRGAGYMIC